PPLGLPTNKPWYLNPCFFSHFSVISRCSSVREVKNVIICPSSNHLLQISSASGYGSTNDILSGSSLGTSSQIVPSISIRKFFTFSGRTGLRFSPFSFFILLRYMIEFF